MNKIILFTMLSSFFAFSEFLKPLHEQLTFTVNDVLANAIEENAKPMYHGIGPYNLAKLKSDKGHKCIERAIKGISSGNMPKGIAKIYSDHYVFHDKNCYTKAVIGHFCGCTLQFKNNKVPIF